MTGPAIARMLGMARSTVGLMLRRLGLGKLKALEPKAAVIRYEHAAPGEMIHLDIKKLGRFDVAGHRATGDRQKGRTYRAGFDFLHVCVDDASRLAYTEILPSEGQHDTTAFLPTRPGLARPSRRQRSAGDDRQRLGLPLQALRQGADPRLRSDTCEPDPTRPGPTARPNASSRPA